MLIKKKTFLAANTVTGNYYGLDNSVENEFSLESFDTDGVESFSMSVMKSEDCCGDKDCTQDETTDVNINDQVIVQDVTFEEVQPEQPVQAVESNDSNFNIQRSEAVQVETEGNW